jgi:hypothetical protein
MHEELVAPGEEASPTSVPKVRILHPEATQSAKVLDRMPGWDRQLWLGETDPVISDLFRVVPERRQKVARGSRRKSDLVEAGAEAVSVGDGVSPNGAGPGGAHVNGTGAQVPSTTGETHDGLISLVAGPEEKDALAVRAKSAAQRDGVTGEPGVAGSPAALLADDPRRSQSSRIRAQ